MKVKYFKRISLLLIVAFGSQLAMACKGEPSIALLRDRVRIIAKTQYGLRLQGNSEVPQVTSVELVGETKVGLKILDQATGYRDSRSLWERISGVIPKSESFIIPKTLELIPERNEEDESKYKVMIRDGSESYLVELLFEGGTQRTLKGGCGGGIARIEDL